MHLRWHFRRVHSAKGLMHQLSYANNQHTGTLQWLLYGLRNSKIMRFSQEFILNESEDMLSNEILLESRKTFFYLCTSGCRHAQLTILFRVFQS